MPSTFEALSVVLLALLPGGLFMWALERLVGRYGIGFSDRLLRFVGASTILHVFAAPLTYNIWHDFLRTDAVPHGELLPLWLWPVSIAYIAVPIALGTLWGLSLKRWELPEFLAGANPAPTAWDHFLSKYPEGWIRMKLKSGSWIGGAYSDDSYAGGYPEEGDIFVSKAADVDPVTGEFLPDDDGNPVLKEDGFLVRWSEIEFLLFAPR